MQANILGIKYRATITAIEAILKAGNRVEAGGIEVQPGAVFEAAQKLYSAQDSWRVYLIRPPKDIIVGHINEPPFQTLRLENEPEFPGEYPAGWAERGTWMPCPKCGTALLWAEAGYVPGWRICLNGHFARLPSDGREARYEGDIPEGSEYYGSSLESIRYKPYPEP
jgi:hypothetical protein